MLPWTIGALWFFIDPLVSTIRYSFSNFVINDTGSFVMKPLENGLFSNYRFAFTKDPDFLRFFGASLKDMAYQLPIIVIFALFIAIILNQKFRGKAFMRAMFFLPVIITTGLITTILKTSLFEVARGDASGAANLFNSVILSRFLEDSGLSMSLVTAISGAVNNIVDLVWQSGVQILIFITGLLSIPPTYYEVAQVEGASAWSAFWKITFPMIIPYILVNMVYTTIDIFTGYSNQTMQYIVKTGYKSLKFSYSSAMAWIYFLVVMGIIGLVFFIISKFTYSDAKQ